MLGQAGVRRCTHCCPCHRPLPMPVNEARAHSPSGSSLPGVGRQPHFLAEVAEAQGGEGIGCIDPGPGLHPGPPFAACSVVLPPLPLAWPEEEGARTGVRKGPGGLHYPVPACRRLGGWVLSPPPAGRHAWPAWVITSQHFILLVSFHFLEMWAPKYFIPACSRPFLPEQTAGPAAGP